MKINSAYTEQELDFDIVEKQDPTTGNILILIKHDALRDVIYNQLCITEKGSVSYRYILADKDHSVVECTIDDGNGRVVTEIGESTLETLENEISRTYPTLIATQRAFDRAAILLLKLSGKYLSNIEMNDFISLDYEPVVEKDGLADTSEPVLDNSEDEPFMEAPISTGADGTMFIPSGINDVVDEPVEPPVTESDPEPEIPAIPDEPAVEENSTPEPEFDKEARIAELGGTVFGAGKYKGKNDTIEQIYKSDNGEYFNKLLKIAHPAAELVDVLDLVREYIELL